MVDMRDSRGRFIKGSNPSPETQFKKGDKGHLGYKHSQETKLKLSLIHIGKKKAEENHKWKGGNVGYSALHSWIRRNYGKPQKCENCGKEEGRIEWANISKKYERDRDDWKVLCKKCHHHYDFGNNKKKRNEKGQFISD